MPLKFKRKTMAEWSGSNPVLAESEPGFCMTLNRLKIGDGVTPWNSLPYIGRSLSDFAISLLASVDAAGGRTALELGTAAVEAASAFAAASHTHPQSAVTNLVSDLQGKAASSHTHAQSEVTNLVSDLVGKAASGHNHAGVYEPVLGNPGTNGHILSSTTGGTRSWVAPPSNGQPVGMATIAAGTLALALATNVNVKNTPNATGTFTTTVPAAGVQCVVIVIQGNTTAKTMTFGSGFKPSGTLVLGTTANRQFAVSFISDGTNLIETSRTAAMAL